MIALLAQGLWQTDEAWPGSQFQYVLTVYALFKQTGWSNEGIHLFSVQDVLYFLLQHTG